MRSGIERKRQARGQARIQSLLGAAELVFARAGYGKATTNEIAAEADVSPATLYQFFKNKEEIANALALKYTSEMSQLHETLDFEWMAKQSVKVMVTSLTAPLLEFHETHPAFLSLLLDAPLSAETRKAKMAMSGRFIEQMSRLFVLRIPTLSETEAVWRAEITLMIYKGFVNEIHEASGARKAKLADTLVNVIAGVIGEV